MQSANPVAVYNYLFAQRWNNEPEEVAGVVVLSTVISIATIPLLLGWLTTAG
jgi:predicted permease